MRLAWLQIDYYEHGSRESLDELIDFVSPSFEFRTRIEAAKKLKALGYLDAKLLDYMLDGHFSYNPRLRGPMKDILVHYANTLEGKKLIREVIQKGEWNDWEKKRIAQLPL